MGLIALLMISGFVCGLLFSITFVEIISWVGMFLGAWGLGFVILTWWNMPEIKN